MNELEHDHLFPFSRTSVYTIFYQKSKSTHAKLFGTTDWKQYVRKIFR
jgi:hypothetical protein